MPNTEANESSDAEYYRYLQLKQKMGGAPAPAPEMGWGEYLGRGVTDALPVAGMAGGGLIGSPAGPVGSVGAAGLGYAAGSEARGLLNHYAFGDALPDTKPVEQVKRVAGNVAEGASGEMGGQLLTKASGLLMPAARSLGLIKSAEPVAVAPEATPVASLTSSVKNDGLGYAKESAATESPGEVAARARAAGAQESGGIAGASGPGNDPILSGRSAGPSPSQRGSVGASASDAPIVGAGTDSPNVSAKRNIVITPVIDELTSFRKMLPKTAGQDIDSLIQELRGINKSGKVNSSELDAVKSRIKDVLASQDTGPHLRRAAVLAQDAVGTVKIPGAKFDPFFKKPSGAKP